MSTGEQLKKDLGLSKFKYVMIQKIIDFPISFYVVTVDSRFPSVYLTYSKIKKAEFTSLQKIKVKNNEYNLRDFKLTPSFPIEEFNGIISSNAMVLTKDLAGEYFRNKSLYEYKNKKYKKN